MALKILLAFALDYYLLRTLHDPRRGVNVAHICSLGILASQMILFLIPVEVNFVSNISTDGRVNMWATMDVLLNWQYKFSAFYYSLFGISFFYLFVLLPYSYYHLQKMESMDGPSGKPTRKIMLLLAVFSILLIIGGFMSMDNPAKLTYPWFLKLVNQSPFERPANFVIGIFFVLGFTLGFSLVSAHLVSGKAIVVEKNGDVIGRLFYTEEKIKQLEQIQNPNQKQLRLLEQLRNDERVFKHRLNMMSSRNQEQSKTQEKAVRTAQRALGYLGLFGCVLIFTSVMMTSMDKTFHSCGSNCRYLVASWMDIIVYSLLSLFLYLSTFFILKGDGITVMGMEIVKLGWKRTPPSQIIIGTWLIIFSNFGWTFLYTVLAPQYTSFGTQTFCSSPMGCAMRADLLYACQPNTLCTPTVYSTLVSRVLYVQPWFGMWLHYLPYLFSAIMLFGLLKAITPTFSEEEEPLLP
ncbi:hypothetical protein EDD86DRAFT_244390 [Gorgonomyces haynaldii]|nr:hypothetical protein EDD86DRAFT_244390 [Gorgonomyces haynaldii]